MKQVLLLAVAVVLSSCTKHEEIIDNSLKIGNIYCSDGSIVNPSLFNKDGNKKAIGIVFWYNNGNQETKDIGYAVALQDLQSDFLIDAEENISNVSEDENALNGASNTAAIKVYAAADTIPINAVEKVLEYKPEGVTGWFIASAGQARLLSSNIAKVYETMDAIGGEKMPGWYWTSTEDAKGEDNSVLFALIYSINENRMTPASKKSINKIRPIIAIR